LPTADSPSRTSLTLMARGSAVIAPRSRKGSGAARRGRSTRLLAHSIARPKADWGVRTR
jgi:hypothetical protein